MDRHVIPSMILSILIVCFFSIMLYESDRQAPITKPAAGAATAAASDSALRNGDKSEAPSALPSKSPDSARPGEQSPQADTKEPAKAEAEPAQAANLDVPSTSVAGSEKTGPVPGTPAPTASTVPAATASDDPSAASSQPQERPTEPSSTDPKEKEKPATPAASSSPAPIAHRAAYTTVKDGEALEDVSARVYGSTDQVDIIWRANRDILPKRNTRLLPGTVLRTPAD